jgi:hypothetical protein
MKVTSGLGNREGIAQMMRIHLQESANFLKMQFCSWQIQYLRSTLGIRPGEEES